MPYYETVFENGDKSVGEYNDDEEALRGAQTHHQRAMEGMPANMSLDPGDPARSIAASRVVHLFKYDQHPNEYNPTQLVSVKDAQKALEGSGDKAGLANVHDLANTVRAMASPVAEEVGPHDSMYKMEAESDIWKAPEA